MAAEKEGWEGRAAAAALLLLGALLLPSCGAAPTSATPPATRRRDCSPITSQTCCPARRCMASRVRW